MSPSFIRTVTVGSGVPPDPALFRGLSSPKDVPKPVIKALVGYTTDREFMALSRHVTLPRRFLFGCFDYNAYALTMQSTGQTLTHLGESW